MHVHRDNQPAQELYQKMGFEVILSWLLDFVHLACSLLSCYCRMNSDAAIIHFCRLSNWQALNYWKRKLTCFASKRERAYRTQIHLN